MELCSADALLNLNSQSGAPYCVTWHLATDETTYTVFDCDVGDSMPVREMLATPLESITATTTGSDSASASATPSSSSTSGSSSSGSVSSPSGPATSGGSSSDSDNSDNNSEAATAQSSHTSASPAGAIAGGVVGGLFVIGLTILGLVLLYRRRSKRNTAGREKLVASPPPPATGPQEIASSDTASPLYDPINGPGSGNRWEVDGAPALFEAPDTSRVPEAPYAPARGQEANRAELC